MLFLKTNWFNISLKGAQHQELVLMDVPNLDLNCTQLWWRCWAPLVFENWREIIYKMVIIFHVNTTDADNFSSVISCRLNNCLLCFNDLNKYDCLMETRQKWIIYSKLPKKKLGHELYLIGYSNDSRKEITSYS